MAVTEDAAPETMTSGNGASTTAVVVDRGAEASALERVLGATDHHVIGRLFVGLSLVFMMVDLLSAVLVAAHRASGSVINEALANILTPNHLLGLLLCGVLPLTLGVALIVVPRQVGAPGLSMPRAAALSLWLWAGASILIGASMLGKGGYGGTDTKLVRLGNISTGVVCLALAIGLVSVLVTILAERPAGLGLAEIPFFAFSMLVGSTVWLLNLGVVVSVVVRGQFMRPLASDINTVVLPKLGWLVSAPALFMVIVPVLGIALDAAGAASGRRQVARGPLQGAIVLAALASFGGYILNATAAETAVWVIGCVVVAIPPLLVLGAVVANLMGSDASFTPGALAAVAALLTAVLAGVSAALGAVDTAGAGRLMGLDPEMLGRGTLYLVVGAGLLGAFAGLAHWGPIISGRRFADRPGQVLTGVALAGFGLLALPHLALGVVAAADRSVNPKVFMWIAAVGGVLALVAVAATAALHWSGTGDAADEPGGPTLEWLEPDEVPTMIESPYPLLDAREAN
jgi:cytochrome c oxidase subunit I+III